MLLKQAKKILSFPVKFIFSVIKLFLKEIKIYYHINKLITVYIIIKKL